MSESAELFLHELFVRLGASMQMHPPLPESMKRPDFLVTCSDGRRFILEATLFTAASDKERRWAPIFDAINNEHFPCWFSILRFDAPPQITPSSRRIISFLKSEVERWQQKAEPVTSDAFEGNRVLEYRDGQVSFSVSIIPKSDPNRRTRSIGIRCGGVRSGGSEKAIRDDLHDKAKKYGSVGEPFVIAINSQSLWTHGLEDIEMALLGTQREYVSNASGEQGVRCYDDGFWGTLQNPKYTRVSGVMFTSVDPYNVGRSRIVLYVNDRAVHPLTLSTWPFEMVHCGHAVRQRRVAEKTLAAVLEIDEDWPGELFG